MKKTVLKTLFLTLIPLILLSACSTPSTPQEKTASTATPALQYCNVDDTDICLEGFGQENEEKTFILLRANNADFRAIHLEINENSPFTCLQSERFPENIYCGGVFFQNGEEISIAIYNNQNEELIVQGEFTIEYSPLQPPDDLHPPADYPDYPNYPN